MTFTPASSGTGVANVTVAIKDTGGTANGGVSTSAGQTFAIAVTSLNDPPSFTKGANVTVLEDSGAKTIAKWAKNIKTGPPNESTQTVTFQVSNDNAALFSIPPAISADGNLTFTVAGSNANGAAKVTAKLKDDGGTAGGGIDTSAEQTVTIAVKAVNDPPSLTLVKTSVEVLKNAAKQSLKILDNISAGPTDESSQTLSVILCVSDTALFAEKPVIDAKTGILTFRPATDAVGSSTVEVSLKDSAGGVSEKQTLTIAVVAAPTGSPNWPAEILAAARRPSNGISVDGAETPLRSEVVVSSADQLRLRRQADAFRITVPTVANQTYWLEFKDALAERDWRPLAALAGDGTERELIDPAATPSSRFYRVRVESR